MTGPSPGQAPRDADLRVISLFTTDHFALSGARGQTTAEVLGRATLFLGTISGTLVALSLLATATELGWPFIVAALVLTPSVIFLGVVTFVRVLESSIEDILYARGINRLRHAYLEIATEWRPYFIKSDHDDTGGVMANMALSPDGRSQIYLTTAGMVSIINAVLLGSYAGGVLTLLGVGLELAVAWAAAVFVIAVALQVLVQRRAWDSFSRRYPPQFSGEGAPRA